MTYLSELGLVLQAGATYRGWFPQWRYAEVGLNHDRWRCLSSAGFCLQTPASDAWEWRSDKVSYFLDQNDKS